MKGSRTVRATALAFVLVSWGGIALTSSGSSSALGNVINITPTSSAVKSNEVLGSEPVLSNRGEIVSAVVREADLATHRSDVAFVGAPAQEPAEGKHVKELPGFDVAVSGDGCVGVVTGEEQVLLVTGLCGDPSAVTTTTLLDTGRLILSDPALSYDGHYLAVEAQLGGSQPYIARIDTTLGEIDLEAVGERLRVMPTPDGYPLWYPDADHGLDISDAGDVIVATFERIDYPVGGTGGFDTSRDPGIGSGGAYLVVGQGSDGPVPVPASRAGAGPCAGASSCAGAARPGTPICRPRPTTRRETTSWPRGTWCRRTTHLTTSRRS